MQQNPRLTTKIRAFAENDKTAGLLLLAAAAFGLVMANTPLSAAHAAFAHAARLPVNDGLMVVFFFFAGLEIKRECLEGALSSRKKAALPALAALCGMIVPALLFCFINRAHPAHLSGWAIPSATDIAFALGVLALAGKRAPPALRVLLLAIAVLDDVGAVAIIAFFYTHALSFPALAAALACLAGLFALQRRRVVTAPPYIALAVLLWLAVLFSGVHATVAGVLAAFFIPLPLLRGMEHALKPFVALLVMPLFAFANAGVDFSAFGAADLLRPLPLGIAAGLFIGKQAGIFGAILLAVKSGHFALPRGLSFRHIYGLSLLCGIGFTMSLFIGALAFDNPLLQAEVRTGVLAGSLLSAVLGWCSLRYGHKAS